MNPRDQFERTVCACPDCSRHCKQCPGNLIPGDVERIAKRTGLTPERVADYFLLASPGALVGTHVDGAIVMQRIPTIVSAMIDHCVFLDDEGMCLIHDAAPYGCGWFDEHMPSAEADQRSKAGPRVSCAVA
jgi:hypothetical protein